MGEKQPGTVKELAKFFFEFSAKLDEMNTSLSREMNVMNTNLGKEMEEINRSMTFMNKSFEDFKEDLATTVKEVKELRVEQQTLKDENRKLTEELTSVKSELVELKQYSRANNLEVKGLPQNANEVLDALVVELGTRVGAQLCPSDIDTVHRVPSKTNGVQNVVVRFVRRSVRDQVLQKAKKHRLTSADLGFHGTEPIFVNEHLCLENKILLSKTIRCKKEKGWKFAWVSQGKIFMRKNENSDALQITCDSDLSSVA